MGRRRDKGGGWRAGGGGEEVCVARGEGKWGRGGGGGGDGNLKAHSKPGAHGSLGNDTLVTQSSV